MKSKYGFPGVEIYISSGIVALLIIAAAMAGTLYPDLAYPAEELKQSFLTNDIVTMIMGVPLLIILMVFSWKKNILALLLWPGVHLFFIYNNIAALFALTGSGLFLLYLVTGVMNIYIFAILIMIIKGDKAKKHMESRLPCKSGGMILTVMGVLFTLRAAMVLSSGTAGSEFATLIADIMISPLWILTGIAMIRKTLAGYRLGPALLLQGTMLFAGLILFMAVKPVMTGADFILADFVVIAVMSFVFLVPFVMMLVKVWKK